MKKAVLLISYRTQSNYKLLFLRQHNAIFYHFPIARQMKKKFMSATAQRLLGNNQTIEVADIQRIGVTGYQPRAGIYLTLKLFEIKTDAEYVPLIDYDILWMNKEDTHRRMAQMSNAMQDYILPYMDAKQLW
jgi:hypothetical protein